MPAHIIEAALQYAGRGWPVLPCRDKAPLVRGGVHSASRDPATIAHWWRTWPQAEIAIACGSRSGIAVIDIDAPAQVPELLNLQTLSASTPSGGRHLYCRYVEGIANRVFAWGELRATGLYVIAPPGQGREWLGNGLIAEIPEHLLKARTHPETPMPQDTTVTSLSPGTWADAIADHCKTAGRWSRQESFSLVACWKATERVLNAEHRMISLNAEVYSLGRLWARGWIERSRIARGMEVVSCHNGLVAKRGLEVVRMVILGALLKGAARPYPDLPKR
jgi:hypothetical protein